MTNLSNPTVLSPEEQAQMDWEKDLEPFIDNSGGFSTTASVANIITLLEKAKLVSRIRGAEIFFFPCVERIYVYLFRLYRLSTTEISIGNVST